MKRYRYYSILDSKKETVGLVKAYSLGSAIKKAAAKKQLDTEEFTKLFNVEEIEI